jgi:hypothetical protein
VKKRALLPVLLAGIAAVVAKRKKAQQAEHDLWNEAAQAPDLR